MAEGQLAGSDSSSPDKDHDFDPTPDMLVHEYDDERTMEEEEAMSGGSCSNELDELQKEGEMPLEDLLTMYGYSGQEEESCLQDARSSSEEEILNNQDLTLDKNEIARDLLPNSDEDDKETSVNDLIDSVASSQTARLLRSNSQAGSEDDDPEDYDYQPDVDEWKKPIQIGSDYQASVPEGLSEYGDAPAYENEDRLLWDPSKLEDDSVQKYLESFHEQNMQNVVGVNAIPTGTHIRDDEQALYLLLQCAHNVDEALRRRKMQAVSPTDPMSLWSEEECRNFENGLKTYGKEFHIIQQNKVRTRSVGELVQFYYLWKKTERHDIFANKNRLEKKKYTLHPGVTDYMDRFLDQDQDSPSPATRDRSASPNINLLIYGDQKRHQLRPPVEAEDTVPFQPIDAPLSINSTSTAALITGNPEGVAKQHDVEEGPHLPSHNSKGGNEDCIEQPCSKKCKLDLSDNTSVRLPYLEANHINTITLPVAAVSNITNDSSLTNDSVHFPQPEPVAQ